MNNAKIGKKLKEQILSSADSYNFPSKNHRHYFIDSVKRLSNTSIECLKVKAQEIGVDHNV